MALKIHGIVLTDEITKDSDIVTTKTNTPSAMTAILEIKPEQNELIIWPNDNPIMLKLYDSSGNEVEATAVISLWKVHPGRKQEEKLAERIYANWRNTDFSDQSDPKRRESLTLPFSQDDKDGVVVPPGYWLELRIKTSLTIDWDYSSGDKVTAFVASIRREVLT